MAPAPEPLHRETSPQKLNTLKSVGGIEGIYKLISDGTEEEKEAFINACQGF